VRTGLDPVHLFPSGGCVAPPYRRYQLASCGVDVRSHCLPVRLMGLDGVYYGLVFGLGV